MEIKYKLSDDGKTLVSVAMDIISLVLPDNVETIEFGAISNKQFLISIDGLNVKTIDDHAITASPIRYINIPNVIKIGDWSIYNTDLINIDIPNAFEIGEGGLYNNLLLEIVNAPNCRKIEHSAFANCISLEVINIPNVYEIGNSVFNDCSKLHTINSKLNPKQLLLAFGDEKQYNNYLQRNRDIKLKNLINES